MNESKLKILAKNINDRDKQLNHFILTILNDSKLPQIPIVKNFSIWKKIELYNQCKIIKKLNIINKDWYLHENEDVKISNFCPIKHFVEYGFNEGRAPNPSLKINSGVNTSYINTLRSSDLFDENWYIKKYPDVASLNIDPAEHYLWIGAEAKYNPSAKFDTFGYLTYNIDVSQAGINPLLHYILYGKKEAREIYDAGYLSDANNSSLIHIDNLHASQTNQKLQPVVIVPIYNAEKETRQCILSILKHTSKKVELIFIDDASTDSKINSLLSKYGRLPNVTIKRNKTNIGFTRTVNIGIRLAEDADVIILNSDTIVTPFWLRNLRFAAYGHKNIATVTPFSNNAGAFSAPLIEKNNKLPSGIALDDYARLIMRNSERLYPETPTGNGFCMYVRRDCIDKIGLLDEKAFPRGYGEENDFCMRALRAGWKHIVDDSTLIYHASSASFGEKRYKLMEKGIATVKQFYPEYQKYVDAFINDTVVDKARKNIANVMDNKLKDKVLTRILYVISTQSGGVPLSNEDLMHGLSDKAETFVLHCDSSTITLFEFIDGKYKSREFFRLENPIKAYPHRSEVYDIVIRKWLINYAFELIHIQHIAWHSLGLIDEASHLEIPIAFSFHDFYTVCANTVLVDNNLRHCAGKCTRGNGKCEMVLWDSDDYPPLKHNAVYKWRVQFSDILKKCSLFFAPSEHTKKCVMDNYPFLRNFEFKVIPHERDFIQFDSPKITIQSDTKLRLIVPGNININKGGNIISNLSNHAEELGIEIHLLGNVAPDVNTSSGIILHGAYGRDDFIEKVQEIKPHIGGIFSIWPETYCYVLTELWACGIPVIGFPLGAIKERINSTGGGWLCKSSTSNDVIRIIKKIKNKPCMYDNAYKNVLRWQESIGKKQNIKNMADSYWDYYMNTINPIIEINADKQSVAINES